MSAVAGEDSRLLTSGTLRFTARAVWFDAEQRLAASAASGVDAEVVSPFPPLLNYALAAGAGRDLARWVSEYIASLCAAAAGRIYGLGTVPLQDPDLAAGELAGIAGLGLAGVEIASNVAGVSLADPRFLGFFAEAERLGMAVFVHAMPAPSDRLPGPAVATFGVGVEGALAAAAIITSGVAEKYPALRLAFSHAAGGFPLMLTRAQWFWGRDHVGGVARPHLRAHRPAVLIHDDADHHLVEVRPVVLGMTALAECVAAAALEVQRRGVHEHHRELAQQVALARKQPLLDEVLDAARRVRAHRLFRRR